VRAYRADVVTDPGERVGDAETYPAHTEGPYVVVELDR
jgi:hypothetical protein